MVVSAWRLPGVHLVVLAMLGILFSGCLMDDNLSHVEREEERLAARLAELEAEYQNGTGALLGLADFPDGADWIALDLVVTEPVDQLRIELTGVPSSDPTAGMLDARSCVSVFYDGVGGWIGYRGDGYTLDTHEIGVPGPDAPTAKSGGGAARSFESPRPLADHRILVAVDDAAAWLERGEDFGIEVPDGVQVYWRVADHGNADCVLHLDEFTDDGVGARVAGIGAGAELYRKWQSSDGGWMGVLFQADLAYHIYVVWQDQYAWTEWDSSTSLATTGGYGITLPEAGAWGVYAPQLAGKDDTYLRIFFADGYESLN